MVGPLGHFLPIVQRRQLVPPRAFLPHPPQPSLVHLSFFLGGKGETTWTREILSCYAVCRTNLFSYVAGAGSCGPQHPHGYNIAMIMGRRT